MANRNFTTQFYSSLERQPIHLMGSFTQTSLGARATLTTGSITMTAVAWGPSGNSITLRLVDPGADGALSILVTGNAIVVTLAYAVGAITTTYTALRTALQADPTVTALATTTGTSGSLVTAIAATPLAGGANSVFSSVMAPHSMSLAQTDTGLYSITLSDTYSALLSGHITLQAASAVDLSAQMISADTLSTKIIAFRMIAGATPTSMANGNTIYIDFCLRNSSN